MRFFFYGTLLAGNANDVARDVHRKLCPLGPAIGRGRLYAIADPQGWYPVLLPGAGTVHGMVYETAQGFGRADLARLDAYEDFDPADLRNSLYLRRIIAVTDQVGLRSRAHAYRFNRPLPQSARPIPTGDFRAWLDETGLAVFGGLRSG